MHTNPKPIGILIKLAPEVVEIIDNLCGGPTPTGTPGVYGSGRAGWIRGLVYEKLKIKNPRTSKNLLPLDKIHLPVLNDLERLVVTLSRQFSVPHVIRYLDQEKIRPHRGRRWHSHQIEAVLNSAAAKSYSWLVGQLDEAAKDMVSS